jgi:CheY-like chemotaxis protein/PAS domain-containing protein/anti-sigma regulatory factor (Ser/Thr protein kinase)
MEYWDISYDGLSTKVGLFDMNSLKFIKINKIFNDRIRENWENPKLHQDINRDITQGNFIRGTIGNKECPFSMIILKRINDYLIGEVTVAYGDETSSNSLTNLFDLTSDGVWEWYPTENYEYMSKRFWDILGYNVNELTFDESNKANYIKKDKVDYIKKTNSSLVPVSWNSMIFEDDRKIAEEAFVRHIDSKGKYNYNVKIKYTHKDGHTINVACRGNVVEWLDNGRPWRMIGTHTDITKIANYDMVMAKYRFVSRMSHEIRTPLAVIISILDTFDFDNEDKMSENINTLKKFSHQLLRISNNVLSLSQLENKQSIKLNITSINLTDEIKSIVKELKDSANMKKIKISIMEDSDIPLILYCDIGKIRQILTNMLSNSIKFSPNDSRVCIIIECILKSTDDCTVKIFIEDHGRGIDKSKWFTIFNEFDQGNDENLMEGAGLGLYIAKCLSEIISGTLMVEKSDINVGTTMKFEFKASLRIDKKRIENINYMRHHNYLISYKFNRVLIVDDIEVMRQCLSVQMDKVAYCKDIIYATNGLEAYNIFIENDGNFDLIFMDCLMPIMDGFTCSKKILQWLKDNNKEPIDIVAITASISENINTECTDAGMQHVIYKPYTSNDLVNVIKKLKQIEENNNEENYNKEEKSSIFLEDIDNVDIRESILK